MAQTDVNNAENDQKVSIAQQTGSRATVKGLESQLKFYTLRAPIAGWLDTIQVVPGQTIAIGTPVADIIDLRDIDVSCLVPPSRVGRLALDQPGGVVRPEGAGTDHEPEGKVVYIGRQAQSATGSFPKSRFVFPTKSLIWPPTRYVQLLIRTTAPQGRLVIPVDALMEDQDPPGVVIVPVVYVEENEKVGKVRVLQAKLGVYNPPAARLVEKCSLWTTRAARNRCRRFRTYGSWSRAAMASKTAMKSGWKRHIRRTNKFHDGMTLVQTYACKSTKPPMRIANTKLCQKTKRRIDPSCPC